MDAEPTRLASFQLTSDEAEYLEAWACGWRPGAASGSNGTVENMAALVALGQS